MIGEKEIEIVNKYNERIYNILLPLYNSHELDLNLLNIRFKINS